VEEQLDVEAVGAKDATGAEGNGDWREWLDGRPRRLKRGKHYTGDPKAVVRRARTAAAELGRTAVESLDSSGSYEHLWIQFVDGEVGPGSPCPRCGGTALEKAQKFFLRCLSCGSTLKAADDWEVIAGSFPREQPEPEYPDDADGEVGRALPSNDLAEILGVRLLCADGQETLEPSGRDEFSIEFGIRFLRAVDWALPRVTLSSVRLHPPLALHPAGPETVDARVRVPGHLLSPRRYAIGITLLVLPDRTRPDEIHKLVARDALEFEVCQAAGTDPSLVDAELDSSLEWTISVRAKGSEERTLERST
jgi:hypothetical protein